MEFTGSILLINTKCINIYIYKYNCIYLKREHMVQIESHGDRIYKMEAHGANRHMVALHKFLTLNWQHMVH